MLNLPPSSSLQLEYMIVDQEDLVKIPAHMSYEEASTLPIACGTAWNALYGHSATIQSGDTVLCMGTGGVSLFAAAVSLLNLPYSEDHAQ